MSKAPSSYKHKILDTIGSLIYIAAALQWLWAIVLYLPFLLQSDLVQQLEQPAPRSIEISTARQPSEAQFAFGVIVTVIFMVIAVVVALKIPRTLSKGGQRITHGVADATLPLLTRHQPQPKQKRLTLSGRVLAAAKLLLGIIPFIGAIVAPMAPQTIDSSIAATVSIFLATWTFGLIGLQGIAALVFKIPYRTLR